MSSVRLSDRTRQRIERLKSDQTPTIKSVLEHAVEVSERLPEVLAFAHKEAFERGLVVLICAVGGLLQRHAGYANKLDMMLSTDRSQIVIRESDGGRTWTLDVAETMRGPAYRELYESLIEGAGIELLDLGEREAIRLPALDPVRRRLEA